MSSTVFMINTRGRRVSVDLRDIEQRKLDGWIFKPEAREEYYPDLDQTVNKGRISSHRFDESIDDTQNLEIIVL